MLIEKGFQPTVDSSFGITPPRPSEISEKNVST